MACNVPVYLLTPFSLVFRHYKAEEITLTIGQAFDLAYKRFLERQTSQNDKQRQFFLLQQQVSQLQAENKRLKERVAELEAEKHYANALSTGTTEAVSAGGVSQPAAAKQQPPAISASTVQVRILVPLYGRYIALSILPVLYRTPLCQFYLPAGEKSLVDFKSANCASFLQVRTDICVKLDLSNVLIGSLYHSKSQNKFL